MKSNQLRTRPGTHQSVWDRIWRDRSGKVVLWQRPNALLIAWAVVTFLSLFVPNGLTENIFYWGSEVLLGIWGLLEIWKGVDYFRRLLGLVVLALTIFAAFNIV